MQRVIITELSFEMITTIFANVPCHKHSPGNTGAIFGCMHSQIFPRH